MRVVSDVGGVASKTSLSALNVVGVGSWGLVWQVHGLVALAAFRPLEQILYPGDALEADDHANDKKKCDNASDDNSSNAFLS
jgi:hypothetical protein